MQICDMIHVNDDIVFSIIFDHRNYFENDLDGVMAAATSSDRFASRGVWRRYRREVIGPVADYENGMQITTF